MILLELLFFLNAWHGLGIPRASQKLESSWLSFTRFDFARLAIEIGALQLYSSIGALKGYGKTPVWGSGAGVAFYCKFWKKKVAQKPRRSILLHFGLITFHFHFPKIRKVVIFTIFGPGGRDHDSQNQLCLTLDPPNYFEKYKKTYQLIFQKHVFGEIASSWKLKISKEMDKTRAGNPGE